MKKISSLILSFIFACLALSFSNSLQANHLVGGELTYECIGDDTYVLTLTIYRDCDCTDCAGFDDPANITVFDSNGNLASSISLFSPIITSIPPETDGLCLETIPDVCVEQGLYIESINLPAIAGGYQIVYQRCCRNNTINNIVNPGGTGSTYVTTIPENNACDNSAPVFNNFPPIVICTNSPLVFDHSAFDADGDSLVYELCEPFSGASEFDPAPVIVPAPPYTPVSWIAPFSAQNPLGGDPIMAIDAVTGELTAFPDTQGQYVVAVCVSEYRDGVLINETKRDFQFNVAECAVVLAQAEILGDNETVCVGESITLSAETFGGDDVFWSPADGLSDANSLTPTVENITETVTYTLNVVDTTTGCADEDEVTIFVSNGPTINAGDDIEICAGEATQLSGFVSADAVSFSWSPTTGFVGTADEIAPALIAPNETTTYTLTGLDAAGCEMNADVTVFIFSGNSDAGIMSDEMLILCDGETTDVQTQGAIVDGNDVLAYILHSDLENPYTSIVASNIQAGIFGINSGNIAENTTYYISAVVGPEGAEANIPDFENSCTKIASATPVVFLAPLEIVIDESCDWDTGAFTVVATAKGGYAEYDNTLTYSIVGDFAGDIFFGDSFTAIFEEGETTAYTFTATEICGEATAFNDFYCEKTPIELIAFSGEAQAKGNLLKWITASEENNDYFIVQTSTDGVNFSELTKINGAENTTIATNYEFLDENFVNSTQYYRLSQTDFDGTTTLSSTIAIVRQANIHDELTVSPIPSRDVIQLGFSSEEATTANISIYSTTGQLMFVQNVDTQKGKNLVSISVEDYTAGIYFAILKQKNQTKVAKLIKK